ncbi:MAG: ATP-binding protein [Erysipelotrichaceae bacterium]|nr:ATP-binding protein [Erysipelotrichaceae bacterium]
MFKRKIYQDLLKWKKESNGNSALLIEGARRIGKTTVAEELGKNEYPDFFTIDFSIVSEDFKKNFDNLLSVDDFFSKLFLDLGIHHLPVGSLIIFDEIQFCPKARQAIKRLVADGRYHYIETGSLVSIKENTSNILIPSEEETIQMYPMDYEEFLWAIGAEHEAALLKECFNNRKPFDQKYHQSFLRNFRLYLALGGMPKVLLEYLVNHDFYDAEKEKKRIINLYEDDLRKIDNKYGTICYMVWKQIPNMLSNHSTRFIVSSVDQRADSVLFKNTLNKLEESKIVIPVFKCNDPSGGFALTKDETMFKLYFCDIGLFVSMVYASNKNDTRDIYQKIVLDKLSLNLGMLFENYTAQALSSNGFETYYYSWNDKEDEKNKNYEIDFLINLNGKTTPLEIKSKKVSSLSSLNKFKMKFGKNVGEKYIVKPKPLSYGDNLINLPSYMLFALK